MTEDVLIDLMERMERAELALAGIAAEQPEGDNRKRLLSKANGVALGRGYVCEALKRVRETW